MKFLSAHDSKTTFSGVGGWEIRRVLTDSSCLWLHQDQQCVVIGVSCATVHTLLGLRLGLSRFKNLPKGTKPVYRLAGRWVYLPMFLLIPSNKNQNQALTYNTFKEKKVSLLMTRFSHVSSSLLWSYKWDKLQKSLDTTVSHICCSHNFLLSSLEGKCTKTKASFYK